MAVEESIKIKIQANAEEFKIVSNIINTELGKLGKNFEILEGNIKQTSNAMKGFDNSSKKFNKGIMSISLILQDLPYGFRGIQNNIPALAQGFGVLYLAISAVTAAMTYFVLEGDKMSKGTKKLFDTFKEFVNGVVNDLVNALYPAFKSITDSIKYLWSVFGENIIYQFKIIWDNLLALLKIGGAILANAFEAVTSLIKGDWSKFGDSLLNIFKLAWNGIIQFLSFALKQVGNGVGGFVKIFDKDLGTTILKSVDYTANEFSKKFKFAFKEVDNASKKIDIFSLFDSKKKKEKKQTFKADTSNLELLKAQENYYKDDLFMRRYYALEVLKEEEKLALMEAIFNKSNIDTLSNIAETFRVRRLAIEKSTLDGIQEIRNDAANKTAKFNQDELEKAEKVQKDLYKQQVYFADKRVEAIETRLNTELKINKRNLDKQRNAIKDALAQTAALIATTSNPQALQNLLNFFNQLQAKLEAFPKVGQQVADIINNSMISAFESLGTTIGTGLATGIFDFSALALVLADALSSIGKALISYAVMTGLALEALKDPTKWKLALAAGIAAVAAGAFLKSKINKDKGPKEFANGGIISGPTLGLMGEYPGAANNPEVVAPLDKLQSLIGGSGGQLEARISGNDLLILMNKAGRNNNNTF